MFIFVSVSSWIFALAIYLLAVQGFSGPSPTIQSIFISICVASIVAALVGILGMRSLRPGALAIETLSCSAALFSAIMLKVFLNSIPG